MKTLKEFFSKLLKCASSQDVRTILSDAGDHADLELNQQFGPFSFRWLPYGNKESNISSIGLGTKSGRSLTERITNAQDAVFEAEAEARGRTKLPDSPWKAAEQWFSRPLPGTDKGTTDWKHSQLDRRIQLFLLDSGVGEAPTVDVLDQGVGIRPEDFSRTILSLQEGNKIKNRHLIGAFGQGGASTLAFSDYTIIVSRHRSDPARVGFTVIRVVRLSAQYKEDCYCYLAVEDSTSSKHRVPCVQLDPKAPLYIHPQIKESKAELLSGTAVRHIAYKLVGVEKGLGPTPGNLWHYLHVSMFDPIIPFRVVDLRPGGKNRIISGSRNRLLKLWQSKGEASEADEDEGGSSVRLYRPLEFFRPHGAAEPSIGIEYWVVTNYQKKKNAPSVLRARSSDLFVQPRHPIVGTLNGQNQGELSARYISERGLQMVSQHIVVHIDASRADSTIRRELFSTNREGFKDGPVLESIIARLQELVEEDDDLQEIERELTEKLVTKQNQETKSEVRKQVQKLLIDAGLDLMSEGPAQVKGEGQEEQTRRRKRGKYRKQEPLPTLPFPKVTKFSIVYPKAVAKIPSNDYQMVLVETDADSQYEARVSVRSEPDVLEEISRAPLRGGRIRWRLRPKAGAVVGQRGSIIASLTQPNGQQLTSSVEFEVTQPIEEKSKQASGRVPPFDIVPIAPEEELWSSVWPDVDDADEGSVSYRVVPVRGNLVVYYSTVFEPYRVQIEAYKSKTQGELAELFIRNYEVWIGYHAILQYQAGKSGGATLAEEARSVVEQQERDRVARMQVNQARRVAEIQKKLLRNDSSSDD